MTYLLVGTQNLVNLELDNIKKDIDENNIIKYDLEQISIKYAIEDLNTFNLFLDKKLVIVYNFDLLDEDEELIKYLNNQSENILVLISYKKLDERKKIIKEVKKNAQVLDLNNVDLNSFIKKSLSDYKISNIAINTMIQYCNEDYERIKNEIEKLKMYKLEEKEILDTDIKQIVKKGFDSNIFDLINAVLKKDKKKIFSIYYELIENNEDEIKILGMLANNFRLIYKIKELLVEYSEDAAIKYLDIHPYRFKILKEQSYNFDREDLLMILKDLSNTDIAIKSGKMDKKIAMELFLTKL